jgi:hypothetical protein
MKNFGIFNIKEDPTLELAIELKYGKPVPTTEYFARLPDTVIDSLREKVRPRFPYAHRWSFDDARQYLRDQLESCPVSTRRDIQAALLLYHALLGRV